MAGLVEIADFRRRGVQQGQQFDSQCRLVLKSLGFHVGEKPFRVPDVGIEIDAEGRGPDGCVYWFEFKGSWIGTRPGLRRSDTVKKALASAYLLHHAQTVFPPLVVLTSHVPTPGSAGDRMVISALAAGALLDVICINDPGSLRRLAGIGNGVQGVLDMSHGG